MKFKRGFTLLELVIVIVLLGIMATGISSIIGLSTQTYVNVSNRDKLISSARFAVERLNREIRNALPNSVRVKNTVGLNCIEFVPIIASTTYTHIPLSTEPASNLLTVIPFQGKGASDYHCTASCSDVAVVYPITINDIYTDITDGVGKSFGINAVTKTSLTQWTLTLDNLVNFTDQSPTERLYIVNSPVSYCITGNSLYRYEYYPFTGNSYVAPAISPVLMANNMGNISSVNYPFNVINASLQRNAIVQIKLPFEQNDETIVFNNDIHLKNSP